MFDTVHVHLTLTQLHCTRMFCQIIRKGTFLTNFKTGVFCETKYSQPFLSQTQCDHEKT